MTTVSFKGLAFQKLYSHEHILEVVASMGKQINEYYDKVKAEEGNIDLVVVCVLKGAFMFYSDLVKHIKHPHLTEFIKIRSYKGTESTGQINIQQPLKPETYEGKHVLIVEDIHDTGFTLEQTVIKFKQLKPKSVEIAVLVVRPDKPLKVDLKFRGMDCGGFIVGYGLDYDEFGRNYPDIYQKTQ